MNVPTLTLMADRWERACANVLKYEDERDEVAAVIERAAKQIGGVMRTSHGRALFTRTSEGAVLTGYDADKGTFTFDVYDHYDDAYGMSFSLTLAQIADPEAAIEALKVENLAQDTKDAEEAAERANQNLAALRGQA